MSDNNLIAWEGYTVKEMAEMIVRQQEAIASAFAAGYAEAIEQAAKVADKYAGLAYKRGDTIIAGAAASVRDAIRALARAATTEES